MANTGVSNICKIYFQHKALTQVSGPPNFGSLWVLVDELKANRVNASEHAFLTFKNHLIATFCTADSQFPMSNGTD